MLTNEMLDLIEDVVVDGIDMHDYPDFCDAFISEGIIDGREMTEAELDFLNHNSDFVYQKVLEQLF